MFREYSARARPHHSDTRHPYTFHQQCASVSKQILYRRQLPASKSPVFTCFTKTPGVGALLRRQQSPPESGHAMGRDKRGLAIPPPTSLRAGGMTRPGVGIAARQGKRSPGTGHYKGEGKSGPAPTSIPGTPTSRLATGEAPFRRMAFPAGDDTRSGCVRLPSLLS